MDKNKVLIIVGGRFDPFSEILSDEYYSWDRIKEYCSNETYMRNPIAVIDYYNELRKRTKQTAISSMHYAIAKLACAAPRYEVLDESVLGFTDFALTRTEDYRIEKYGINALDADFVRYSGIRGTIWLSECPDCFHYQVYQNDPQSYGATSPSGKLLRPAVSWPGEDFYINNEGVLSSIESAKIVILLGVDLRNRVYEGIDTALLGKNKEYVIILNDREEEFGDMTPGTKAKYTVYNRITESLINNIANDIYDQYKDVKLLEI